MARQMFEIMVLDVRQSVKKDHEIEVWAEDGIIMCSRIEAIDGVDAVSGVYPPFLVWTDPRYSFGQVIMEIARVAGVPEGNLLSRIQGSDTVISSPRIEDESETSDRS